VCFGYSVQKAPYYPDEHILNGDVLFFEFEFDLITRLLQMLVIDNCMVTVMSSSVRRAALALPKAWRSIRLIPFLLCPSYA
jgi:hypothetical protein